MIRNWSIFGSKIGQKSVNFWSTLAKSGKIGSKIGRFLADFGQVKASAWSGRGLDLASSPSGNQFGPRTRSLKFWSGSYKRAYKSVGHQNDHNWFCSKLWFEHHFEPSPLGKMAPISEPGTCSLPGSLTLFLANRERASKFEPIDFPTYFPLFSSNALTTCSFWSNLTSKTPNLSHSRRNLVPFLKKWGPHFFGDKPWSAQNPFTSESCPQKWSKNADFLAKKSQKYKAKPLIFASFPLFCTFCKKCKNDRGTGPPKMTWLRKNPPFPRKIGFPILRGRIKLMIIFAR